MTSRGQRVVVERTGKIGATDVRRAEGVWGNFVGLMFKASLPDGQGLLFQPARGIHTHFMRFPIDLVYLDKDNRVTKVREAMRPWRFDLTAAAGVIELNAGTARAADIRPGDLLRFEAPDGAR
ncbi:MAG TPA: DUF192 domain-containing protein [Thermomicrobiales bacterium]|nr:DUF192 domain-containing protein [Thermomicrobiales bacterium]